MIQPKSSPTPYEELLALPDAAGFDLVPDWVCEVLSPVAVEPFDAVAFPLGALWAD